MVKSDQLQLLYLRRDDLKIIQFYFLCLNTLAITMNHVNYYLFRIIEIHFPRSLHTNK